MKNVTHKAIKANVWDAHIAKANSSVSALKEYKKSNYQVDGYRINANRIVNGEHVGEDWLRGKLKKELIKLGYCKPSDFEKYNKPNGSINIG